MLRFLARCFLIAMLATHAFFLWHVRARVRLGDPDFTVYYTAARILREGRAANLYDGPTQLAVQREFTSDSDLRRGPLPYIHPPFEALIFVPLTYLPYPAAFAAWDFVNLGLLLAIAILLRRSLPALGQIPLWEWTLALLAFFPVFVNFLQGQDSILLLLLFVLAFRALDRDADFLAGAWLGLAVFKYHFALPLVIVLAIWKARREAAKFISGFAATASLMTALSLAIVGWHGALRYPAYAWRVVSQPGFGQTPPGLLANLLGLVTGWPWPPSAELALRIVVAITSIGLIVVVALMRPCPDRGENGKAGGRTGEAETRATFRLSFACAVVTSLLVAYNTNAHDLCLLVLALALVVEVGWERGWPDSAVLLFPIAPLLVSPFCIFLWMRWERLNLLVVFLLCWIFVLHRKAGLLQGRRGGAVTPEFPSR